MKKNNRVFHETYQVNESTNRYMIEIALDQYTDIFNEWDPSPFKRRELEPDLELYLIRSSDDIPFHYPIELNIAVPKKIRNETMEEEVRKGIKNHFTFVIYLLGKKFNRNNRLVLNCILVGFLLQVIVVVWQVDPNRVLYSIFEEGFLIGSWVFLWQAISLLFFTNRELYHHHRTYKRLRNAPVIFHEVETF